MNSQGYFSFDTYSISDDRKSLYFDYSHILPDGNKIPFKEKVIFPYAISTSISSVLLNQILISLHLAIGISYWKLYCPSHIQIRGYQLDSFQAHFWNTVYTKGLGEFFFKNKINFHGLIDFPYSEKIVITNDVVSTGFIPVNNKQNYLLGIGGGKDSIVALEMLKQAKKDTTGFILYHKNEDIKIKKEVLGVMGINSLIVEREIDKKLFELNKSHKVYNGHVPITAIYSFVGILLALIMGYSFVIIPNGKSSNIGNLCYLGEIINHQWSKSEEFEDLLRKYLDHSSLGRIAYSSILRHMNELEITKEFIKHKKYFNVFSSCNKNFRIYKTHKTIANNKELRWCGKCPKCAFVFTMLSAYLSGGEVEDIFKKNLYKDPSLIILYKDLLGVGDLKPFDCVGTPDEVRTAFYMAYKRNEYKDDVIMNMFIKEVLPNMK
ncbi:hypothetical protein A2334_02060 [Candidatus Roizmanbacteria bacterium RIFOXYB2_FULL_38_10]|uniref:UDP-N-acetyl-alpha-D-muramoyl-L-alanyl-L-glutamate epimerase n=1 Tax=Candidatus Roizmanbacteria bacterium RIFOXYD1_FULL_38_12 TaxID=1802093 RepID=A0A1F7L082_9BACT|nr:MAG: hypothetical protein A3K47_01905 [Candidatus Roizmanbacteria bacterium RIFOXYA2_FULL_38_14]OGK63534.1 MAG: hypothetical protein A3K27_01905 [Candidatus Roizmanbacteria bacterium RIFOXYA1_FULL_37_12]OGK65380.1 MAG: hypothetical protein A3K38_01905 [Candidatus Roizmanbacteria bacterium RIFOXYB1_FULL_40_23]OGK67905.1 MAG: hypothetical protein A2334_02060 [Candidatus Roizmanbacteria bacterium RIFOXYB2_FULL_38_10]OGK69785.1 MAG: hypothetical protein A3K21_01910 [Candidatus Roizmanbacteria ba